MKPITRVIIVPGNGCVPVSSSNWYAWLKESIEENENMSSKISDVKLQDMPDPNTARESIWVPFIVDELGADENTIVVGHSSGAEAAMRLMENYPIGGAILVSACYTDLGIENERASGYYSRPWEWEKMKRNSGFIAQFHSSDDPFIPISEARHVHEQLDTEYYEFDDRSHFFEPFQEIVQLLERKTSESYEGVTSEECEDL